MVRTLLPVGAALLGAWCVLADQSTCSLTQKCPEDAPCCSQYGECGVGAYCLGGCDPRMSYSLDSCMPAPVCESKTYAMDSLDGMVSIDKYLGDASTADWVYQGEPLVYDGNVLLTMPANSVGTVLASSTYMWYGNVKAKLKTSRGAGVVTAFILLSDVKDEIDYEFVGTELEVAQTNYYFQGIPDYDNSANISLSDTYDNFHEYEIQWTPDNITWLVDGQVGRVKQKSGTWNASANQWNFPQTPARVQLSIWPGGASSNAEGTIAWAGGPIDWNSTDIEDYGYDFATFSTIEVQCYNASSPPGTSTGKSYYYDSWLATNNTVVDGDNSTILANLLDTGLDPSAGATASASASSSTSTANSVPGGSSSGSGTNVGGSSGSSGSSGSGSGTSSSSSASCSTTGFSQDCSSSSSTKSDGGRGAERTLGASALAIIVGFVGLMFL